MTPEYAAFLAGKAPRAAAAGIDPGPMNPALFDFQAAATAFALKQGRCGLFLSTGLGKTLCELEFADQAVRETNRNALILSPLAVAKQIEAEAAKFGFDGVNVVRDQSSVKRGISVCNYDRMDKLDFFTFGCIVLDESGILKAFDGATTRALIDSFAGYRFKLAATATPAPNDHVELGTHAEFLEVMQRHEMLTRWFINDSSNTASWRLKGHAVVPFWDWVSSWAVMAETPDDLGFDGSRFVLPEMCVISHRVHGEARPMKGSLFVEDVSATNIFSLKRQTTEARADAIGELVAAEPHEPWVIWVDTDFEADAVMARLLGAQEVRGSHSIDKKEATLAAFAAGEFLHIVTKSRVAGWGVNWQHCARMAFVGRSFSYESWFQSVRRCWRFGQTRPVHVHLIVAEGEDQIGRTIDRKAASHAEMRAAMRAASLRAIRTDSAVKIPYVATHRGRLPAWLTSSPA